ncbi:hypothetical protein ACO1O0_004734 [Amphichorda felina]
MVDQKTLAQYLGSEEYHREDVLRALRGEKLPGHLGYPLIKLCIIRGILHSASFAEGEAAPLRGLPEHPEFTRALNARAIMSNRIPDMDPTERPEELPYCIWYPTIASEDTYRQLSKKCPQMRYQVARACAVAGYTDLYLKLEDVLPEVAVAEEARAAGSTSIFNHIMAQPVRYKVFDDYYRTINLESPQPAPLNGDTCVLSMVESQKQAFGKPTIPDDDDIFTYFGDDGFKEMMYNITEDQGIAESVPDGDTPVFSSADLMLDLLTWPLPADLPAGNKDLLILTAAYYGNIDRYTRLRRPKVLEDEIFCVVRGIYHNSLFALWWERQQNPPEGEPFHMPHWQHIERAITARHIMNNDLSRVVDKMDDKDCLPYLIWYPEFAAPETYRALAEKVPAMRGACARAAIYTGDVGLFDELMALPGVVPNPYLAAEAKQSNNPYFCSALQSRAEDIGVSLLPSSLGAGGEPYEPWKLFSVRGSSVMMKWNGLPRSPSVRMVTGEFLEQEAVYNGTRAETTQLELFLMVPNSWRPQDRYALELDYKDWPPSW